MEGIDYLQHGWNPLKKSIVDTAEAILGCKRKEQPDWFVEAADTLQSLLDAKTAAHERVLKVNSISRRKKFWEHQRIVKRAIYMAKQKCANTHGKCKGRQTNLQK